MSYVAEFPSDYTVPAEILEAVASGALEDISWHNDACPSFFCERTLRRLWVDHPDPEQREMAPCPRFAVVPTNEDADPVYDGEYEVLYEGEDVAEALRITLNF